MSNRGLVPKADQLIREWMTTSNLKPGNRLPSERSLAKELGIPYYSVNRAMAALVSQGLVERQKYKLYLTEVSPPRTEGFSCDVVVARRSVYIRTFRKVARDINARISIHLWDSGEEAVSILQHLDPAQTQGVLFSPPNRVSGDAWEQAAGRLTEKGVPFVCVGQQASSVSFVCGDRERALESLFLHLNELGHRKIAFLTLPPWTLSSSVIISQWAWLCRKYKMTWSADQIFRINDTKVLPEAIHNVCLRLKGEWKEVTALVVSDDITFLGPHLLEELEKSKILVPANLSLAFIDDSIGLQATSPSITATAVDNALVHEAAFHMLERAQRTKSQIGLLPKPGKILILEDLIVRQSTGPAPGTSWPKDRGGTGTILPAPPHSTSDQEISARAYNAWHKPYALALKTPQERFLAVDLGKFVNRPLGFRRGWFGDLPLKNLPSGEQVIHGVPFQVLGGKTRTDCGAIVLQSLVNTTGRAKKLPDRLKIPVSKKAGAIYILHGCGYSQFLNRFAIYSFYSGKKKIGEIPMVSLGNPGPEMNDVELSRAVEQSNIQDWWSDYPHYDFPQARMAPILEQVKVESVQRHSYLYTLEWLNPTPATLVTHIEIASLPNQSTTLGVLAISLIAT